jgi:hypothetical protein
MPSSTAIDQRRWEWLDAALSGQEVPVERDAFGQGVRGVSRPRDPFAVTLGEARRSALRARLRAAVIAGTDRTASPEVRIDPNQDDTPATTASTVQATSAPSIQILERWDGVVISVGETAFRARLLDEKTGTPRVEADIFISEVAPQDRAMLVGGSVFYWHIGYRDPDGDHERISRIRFRRLPPKTAADLRRAERRATEIRGKFGWA